jgi:predicted nucleic acid-binding protein
MAFPAFLDTNVLYGSTLCDTMLRIAEQGAYRPHWYKDVLGELVEVLVRKAGIPRERAERRIAEMQRAFPLAEVVEYDLLIDAMTCDPKDRHVLAAAVQARCEVVVTFNVKDFPPESTEPHQISAVTPDAFLLDQLDLHPPMVQRALVGQVTEANRPPLTLGQLLGSLARAGVPAFAEEARRHEFG